MTESTAPSQRETAAEQHAASLISRMTIPEKAGLLFHQMVLHDARIAFSDPVPMLGTPSIEHMVTRGHLSHFNVHGTSSGREFAEWHNRLQDLAAGTRLGIPVTLSSDPRHAFTDNPATAFSAGAFSQWPESLGLAATRDLDLVEAHADAVRREYTAVGLRVALHPQIDLMTEARWSRGGGTFGESSALSGDIVEAYLRGLRGGDELGPQSVAGMVKHFPGGGPQLDGEDPHFDYGKEQVYPAGAFDDHLAPFIRAIAAGATQMMPYYGQPIGTEWEEVAFGFNRGIITDLLREKLGFAGIVCTDWGLLTDSEIMGQPMPARAWGVEHLTPKERLALALSAGVDQFGGEACPELVVELVDEGLLAEERLDESVARLLREKHLLGLFDDPSVDSAAADSIVGERTLVAAGFAAQQAAVTVLSDAALPVAAGRRIYAERIDLGDLAEPVATPAEAELAIIRVDAPHEARPRGFESKFHSGSLAFPQEELDRLLAIIRSVPTVLVVYLDRPAILTELAEALAPAGALVVDFGASDPALVDVLSGRAEARGRLPFDLPRSMQAVIDSPSDLAFSTVDPLFRFGDGIVAGR